MKHPYNFDNQQFFPTLKSGKFFPSCHKESEKYFYSILNDINRFKEKPCPGVC